MTSPAPPSRADVGNWLREKRTRLRKSQMEVAREAGITQGSVSNYETGKREVNVYTLLRLSAAVDADVAELVGADEPILLRNSRLARAAALLSRAPELLESLAPEDAAPAGKA